MRDHISTEYLQKSFPSGEIVTFERGESICQVHKKVEYFHWLLDGTLSFVMALKEEHPEVEVCQSSSFLLPIGWHGLTPPGRHTQNIVVTSEEATLFRVKLENKALFLQQIFDASLHEDICRKQFELLRSAVYRQSDILPKHVFLEPRQAGGFREDTNQPDEVANALFKKSPFLEPFEDSDLAILAQHAVRRDYDTNDTIIPQDERSDGLYILIEGRIRIQRYGETHPLSQWPITDQGFIFGWPTIIDEPEFCTAQAIRASSVYFIDVVQLKAIFNENPALARRFYIRLNWLTDNHINAAFVRYLSLHFNFDELTIRYLIEHYQTQIKGSSRLHKIPHLLRSSTTKSLAFDILKDLTKTGSSRERRIASISLDLLKPARQEMDFLNQLQKIYETVTEDTEEKDPAEVRKACAFETQKLCEFFNYKVDGLENLPDKPGNIFIYNHLVNHPYYTLNNNFQITLESHFISGEILDRKYGEPGIRAVRIGRTKEYAHQNYYERMGYINVYTAESDQTSKEERIAARNRFFETAKKHLNEGHNLVISPEGTSYHTEDEIPGPFKPGVFRLALAADPEPLIVPIIILYFDKRIHEATKYCRILPPFKVTEHPLYTGLENLEDFVKKYHASFKKELEESKAMEENPL